MTATTDADSYGCDILSRWLTSNVSCSVLEAPGVTHLYFRVVR